MTLIVTTLAMAVVLLSVLVAGLLRSHAEILSRLHALGAGLDLDDAVGDTRTTGAMPVPTPTRRADSTGAPPAPDIAGVDARGDAISVAVAGARGRTLLAFLSSGCGTCQAFWDAFTDPASLGTPADLRVIAVTRGADAESPSTVASLAGDATVVMSSEAWTDYSVPGAPYFVLAEAGHIHGEGTGVTWEQVRRLLGEATGDVSLADLGGGTGATAGSAGEAAIDITGARDEREERIDRALLAAGIRPGDASLYHPSGAGTAGPVGASGTASVSGSAEAQR